MKKSILLNSRISAVIAEMGGHTDTIVIADAGLPIPDSTMRIDIAVCKDVPNFLTTLRTILTELEVEKYTIAEEISIHNPAIKQEITSLMAEKRCDTVTHEEFKKMTKNAKAVIRTGGECSPPYANIILHSGVVF